MEAVQEDEEVSKTPPEKPHAKIIQNGHENNIDFSHHIETNIDEAKEIADVPPDDVERNLQEKIIENLHAKYAQLQATLSQRDELVALQKRELELLEKEKLAIRRDLEFARKEKDTAVVKYAMAERNLIDLKTSNDSTGRRLKDVQKELEAQTNRLKTITSDRDRTAREWRKCSSECEGLRNDLASLETKLKWNQVKLKQDVQVKAALESKVNELTQQVNQLNENRQQNINLVKYEEKETEAQIILLRHTCEAKEKDLTAAHTKLTQIQAELSESVDQCTELTVEVEQLRMANCANAVEIADLKDSQEKQLDSLEKMTLKLEESYNELGHTKQELSVASEKLIEFQEMDECYKEQQIELVKIRRGEENLLQLNKDITEKSVALESKLTLATSKAAALSLETEQIKDIYETHKIIVVELENELLNAHQEHGKQMIALEAVLNEAKLEKQQIQIDLDYAIGEIDVLKRKHCTIVKELNREVVVLRAKLEPPKPAIPAREEIQEPSKKTLIDRIVKLQRAIARQTEKIEFLENHCAALINELKSKK